MNEKQIFQQAFLDEINSQLKALFETKENAVIIKRYKKKQAIAYIMPPLNANWTFQYFGTYKYDKQKVAMDGGIELANFLLKKAFHDSKL